MKLGTAQTVKDITLSVPYSFTKSENEHKLEALVVGNIKVADAVKLQAIASDIASSLTLVTSTDTTPVAVPTGTTIVSTAYKATPTGDDKDVTYLVKVQLGQATRDIEVPVTYAKSINDRKLDGITASAKATYTTSTKDSGTHAPEELDKLQFLLGGSAAAEATIKTAV